MKRVSLMLIVIIGLLGLSVALQKLSFNSGGPGLTASEALAAKKKLKAGMIDPKTGKIYRVKITERGNRLLVRGYVGISLLGSTQTWHRRGR